MYTRIITLVLGLELEGGPLFISHGCIRTSFYSIISHSQFILLMYFCVNTSTQS